MKRPMFISLLFTAFSVTLCFYERKALFLCGIGLLSVIGILIYQKAKLYNIIAVIFAFVTLVSLYKSYESIDRINLFSGNIITDDFTVLSVDESGEDYTSLTVSCKNSRYLPNNIKLRFFVYEDIYLEDGNKINAKVEIFSIDHDKYRESYYSQNIFAKAKIIQINGIIDNHNFLGDVYHIRRYIRAAINNNLSPQSAATVNGILSGDKSGFSDEFYENVKRSGVSHVMVVSGMHLSIIMSMLLFFIDRIIRNRGTRLVVCALVILFICGICGFTMSILRAAVMYLLIAIAYTLKRDTDIFNVLCGAVVLIMIFTPFALFNIGFELSVLATFGVTVVGPAILKKIKLNNKIADAFISICVNSVAAQIVTLPVTVYNFGMISLFAPITNILISYAVNINLIISALSVFLTLLSSSLSIVKPLYYLCDVITEFINFVINVIGEIKFSAFAVPQKAATFITGIIIIGTCVVFACKNQKIRLLFKRKAVGQNADDF